MNPKDRFRRLIAQSGPIPVAQFMAESNALYYASRDPLGQAGDFVTAPEVHQVFGEMVGAWLADLWDRAGRPQAALVELGPGRGTLAADMLRVMRRAGWDGDVHLVEASPVLREVQAAKVEGAQFHGDPSTLPDDAPLMVVGNEFLDALAVRQLVKTPHGWRERMVGLNGEGGLAFVVGTKPMDAAVPAERANAPLDTILETSPACAALVEDMTRRLVEQGGAALFIDYGHLAPRMGSTLQAVRAHERVDPLAHPGEADLTAHVEFSALAKVAQRGGAGWLSATTQGHWLKALGIEHRAAALAQSGDDIDAACHRLVHADEMGSLFKVMAFGSSDWPPGAGFA